MGGDEQVRVVGCAGTTGGVFGFGEDDWLGWCLRYALSVRFAANLVVIGGWLSVGGLVVLGWYGRTGVWLAAGY